MKPEKIIGKTVVTAVTFVLKKGDEIISEKVNEFCGQVVEISEEHGIVICNFDTQRQINLPLFFDSFKAAPKGDYVLRNGEFKVKNPDLICEMTLTKEAE